MIIRIAKYERFCNSKGEEEPKDEYEVFIDGYSRYRGLQQSECDAVVKAFENHYQKE